MRALIVEDSATQAAELRALLEEAGFEAGHAGRLDEALSAVEDGIDVVLLDLGLPDESGLRVVTKMRDAAPEVPIVVLTALEDESTAVESVHAGAQDYLFKAGLDAQVLIRCLRYAIERMQGERALRQSRDDLLSILDGLRIGTIMTGPEGQVTFLSRSCGRFVGMEREKAHGRPWGDVLQLQPEDRSRIAALLERPTEARDKIPVSVETSAGLSYWVEVEIHDHPEDPRRKIFCLYDMSEVRDLRRQLDEKGRFQDLIGKSPPMLRVYELIRQVARVDSTVLIEGATGTGKELVARAVHAESRRSDRPFLAVNCAGLTDSLISSQLFGHKRGSFTGAVGDHKGFFETADGGTLFLDEIGDVPANVQTNLLRVLQEREIVRVGESKPRSIDVRVLAATHHNLNEEAASGRFRTDLLYRVRVARIALPKLRERREDIPLLAGAFLAQLRAASGKTVRHMSDEAMGYLLEYTWPGNVRELRSAIEFALIRCHGSVINSDDLPPEIIDAHRRGPITTPFPAALDDMAKAEADERQRVTAALSAAKGNRTKAARMLGISRATLYRRLEILGIP